MGSFPDPDPPLTPPLPELAFVGRSNVGKSSLINALLARRRLAWVSGVPGKTTALNVYDVGGRLYLVDLPGYGYARVSRAARTAWRRRIARYLRNRAALRAVVWLLDIRRDPSPDDQWMMSVLAESRRPVLAALTKSDKLARGRRLTRARALAAALNLPDDQVIPTSVMTHEGITQLREAVEALV